MSSATKEWFIGSIHSAQIERCNAAKRAVERIQMQQNEVYEKYNAIIALFELRNGSNNNVTEIEELNEELKELNIQAYRAIANAARACAGL